MRIFLAVIMSLFFVGATNAATIVASRTTGVAPLYVHFYDSEATVDSTPGVMPFHDYEYSWAYGDIESGVWGTSGKSKNSDKGAVAAHVFDTPGEYTVTLTVRDSSGIVGTDTETITVTDPTTVFAGTLTTCVNPEGDADFTGCPSGATQLQEDTITDIDSTTYADNGMRILFKRGGEWTLSASPEWPSATTVHVGAYGTCTGETIYGTCTNDPLITMTSGAGYFVSLSSKTDWRIENIRFTGVKADDGHDVTAGASRIRHTLLYKITATSMGSAVSWSNYRTNDDQYHDANAIVSCDLSNTADGVMYVGSERLAVLGTNSRDTDDSHSLRIFQAYQSVIAHNRLSGSDIENGVRIAMKLHGPGEPYVGTFAETGTNGLRYRSKFINIHDNVFGTGGQYTVDIGPQNSEYDERISDVVFEKNKIVSDYGTASGLPTVASLTLAGRYMTARNNIIDGTGSTNDGYLGITCYRTGTEWDIDNDDVLDPEDSVRGYRVYNNTIYNPENLNYHRAIVIGETASDVIIRNNYVSIPNTSGEKTLVSDGPGDSTASNNVSTLTPYFTDPDNETQLSRDFSLTESATEAIDQGYIVPVWDDFLGNNRTGGTYDVGAFEFNPPPPAHGLRITSGMTWGAAN